MKNSTLIRSFLILAFLFQSVLIFSQASKQAPFFDRKKAEADAIAKGIPTGDIEGYLFALEREFYDNLNFKPVNLNDPYGVNAIAKGTNPTVQGAGCPNASFEVGSFGNWTGSSGHAQTCGTGAAISPVYTQTFVGITSPAGANAGLTNAMNYHTVMNIPPTNPNYPTCNQFGYDSIAVKVVGTQTVSEIPHVCPYYTDGVSARMNGALANYRACKLSYNFAITPTNRNITYAFALCIYDGGHSAPQQPWFQVSVKDQFGNPIGGNCGVYNVNATMASTDTSFRTSALGTWYKYRPWRQYGVDLSSPMYATVTAVNLEFTVGGCCAAGHWAYAYVDAECSQGGAYSSLCAGTNTAVLTAPTGYVQYQWYQLPGMTPMSPAIGGNTGTLTINPAIVGQVYQVQMKTPTGCTITLNDTIKISGVNITSIGSTPTCPGGSSGSAIVNVIGSNVGYNYTWVNSANAVVGTNSVATNLPPGIYTVSVTAISCGVATRTVQVGVAPPTYYTKSAPYCGNLAILTATTGTNYQWYQNLTPMPSAAGQQSVAVANPVNGGVYYVTYTTPQGCKDSVRIVLSQIPGGSIYVSNVKPICATSGPVSYGVVNLTTSQLGPFSYTVTGPGSYNSTLINTPSKKDSVVGLSLGTYTANVFDGACWYTTTFTVNPYTFSYTVTPTTPTTLCVTGTVPMAASFGTTVPTACGPSTSGGCTTPNISTLGAGTINNTSFSWPCLYGNYYKNHRHQLLYTAAELLAAGVQPGVISQLQFNVISKLPNGTNSSGYIGTLPGFTIKMKCTNVTVLNSTWDNTGLTTVFNATNYTPVVGWNTHNLTTPYEWDGVSNLLVDVCYSLNTTANWTSNPVMPATNTGVIKTRYSFSDTQPMCGTTAFASTSLNRPNVRFGSCGATNPANFTYLWTPNYALTSTTTQSTVATPSTSTVYSITVNPIGQVNCAQTQTVDITVINPVTPTITSGAFCTNFPPTAITVTPATGAWTPTAYMTAGGVFTPSLAAVGANTVAYTVGTGTCSAASTLTIDVEQYNPATLTGSIVPLCVSDPTINLLGLVANTTGTWTGAGVTANVLDPALAGAGTYNLTYNTNSVPTLTLCPDVSTLQVNIHTIPQPTITQVGPYCNTMLPTQLSVSPLGGVFSGLNNSATSPNGTFDPQVAIIGSNIVGYTVTSGPCVKVTSINVDVEKFVPATLISNIGPYCYNDAGANLNSIVLVPGGTWSGSGIVGNNFSPAFSGPGNFILTYSTFSSPTASLCPDMSTISVHVNPQPLANIVTSTMSACNPGSVTFSSPNVNLGTGFWNFGDNNTSSGLSATHTYTAPGNYFVTFDYMDDIGCRVFTQLGMPIVIHPSPIADFNILPESQISVAMPEAEFINTSTVLQNNTYYWNIGNIMQSTNVNASYIFNNPGYMYITLIATNEFGCTDTITKLVEVKNDYGVWIPNSFTPNGDGNNDTFRAVVSPYGLDLSYFKMEIFDRWGERLFVTTDFTIGWTGGKNNGGDPLKDDVYVYKIQFKTADGEVKHKTGHVTLIK